MLKKDFIDGTYYEEEDGVMYGKLDLGVQRLIRLDYPNVTDEDFITYQQLSRFCMAYMDQIVERAHEKNEDIKKKVTEIMPDDIKALNVEEQLVQQATFGQRVADVVARFGGSWTFILSFMLFMAIWMVINVVKPFGIDFDSYPFILLNLALSTIAAIQAPLIMMSQNRAADYDRLQAKNDFYVNKKSEEEIRLLHEKIDHMVQQDQKELLEIQKLQTELLVSLSNQMAQLSRDYDQLKAQLETERKENGQ